MPDRMLANLKIIYPPEFKGEGPPGYRRGLEEALEAVLAQASGDVREWLEKEAPIVHWTPVESGEGWFNAYLLCKHHESHHIHGFFIEMLRRWLVPGRRLPVLSARQWVFRSSDLSDDAYFIGELAVGTTRVADIPEVQKNLPLLVPELRLGAISPPHARRLLEIKGIGVVKKTMHLHQSLVSMLRRQPDLIKPDIIDDVQQVLLNCPESYRQLRSIRHMRRIIYSIYLARQAVKRELELRPEWRHTVAKVMRAKLQYAFGMKPVLGVTIAVNTRRSYEILESPHIIRAVNQIVPNLRVVEGSFFCYQAPDEPVRTLYLEVERSDRQEVGAAEIKRLRDELATELKGRVERLTHSVFHPPNEEEIYRDIMALSREIRYVRDLPQVAISFQSQDRQTIAFSVIVVRLERENSSPLRDLVSKLPSGVHCTVSEEVEAGFLRKKYVKKAMVFTLSFDKGRFLRRDSAVDLGKARAFVVRCLTQMFGEVRDFNGGLIDKQNEVLKAAKGLLDGEGRRQEFLLENLFYALTPPVMQSYLEPSVIKGLLDQVIELQQVDLARRGGYRIARRSHEGGAFSLVVRGTDRSFYQEVQQAIDALHLDPLHIASTLLPAHNSYYLGYVYLFDDEAAQGQISATVEEAMREWRRRQHGRQGLRINLLRARESFDPRIANDRRSGVLMKMLYEGLTRLGSDGKPELALAESVEVSEDGCTYTFTLRRSKWTNGQLVTARDFVYAWRKVLDPKFRSWYPHLLYVIKNAEAAKEGRIPFAEVGVQAVSDRQLVVELEHPASYFLELTSHWIYLPLHKGIDKTRPGWASQRGEGYICNGPFRLAESNRADVVRLAKNPLYWDAAAVKLEEVEVMSVDDPEMALDMYQQGDLDWIGEPLCDLPMDLLQRAPGIDQLESSPINSIYLLSINTERLPLSSIKMRRAFAAAIDRHHLKKEVLIGTEAPICSLVLNGSCPVDQRWMSGDQELAQRLFTEGLEELDMRIEDLPTITLHYGRTQEQEGVARHLAAEWSRIFGLKIRTEGHPWHTYIPRFLAGDLPVAGFVWHPWISDPIYNFDIMRYRTAGYNPMRWENPDYYQLLEEVDFCPDPAERQSKIAKADELVRSEVPCIPVYRCCHYYLKRPELENVWLTPDGQIDFKTAYIGEGKS